MDLLSFLPVMGYGSGWALVAVFVAMLFRGDVVTRREHDATRENLTMTQQALNEALEQNRAIAAMAPVVRSTFATIQDEAKR